MHFHKATSVVGYLALASLVSAVPLEKRSYQGSQSSSITTSSPQGTASASPSGLHSSASGAPPSTGSSAPPTPSSGDNPFKFPLPNGFPNISAGSAELNAIEDQAHGLLPNGPPPPAPPAADDLTSLRLIAFNELFEVAFFTELLANITNNVPGYEVQDPSQKQALINEITAVVAQEELHELNANNALAKFNAGPIQPCEYIAGVSTLPDAIKLAATFTDVVLGTLGDVQTHFGQNGDAGLIRGVAAVIGQEGEQDGFYRNYLGELPSQAPFLTASTREFAFSALNQMFIVPGSCPNLNTIDLPIFGVLNLLSKDVKPQDQTLQFSFSTSGKYSKYSSIDGLSLVLINQQNVPVVEPLGQPQVGHDGTVTFSANFPFSQFKMHGLTIAVVAEGSSFATVADVAKATVFGPALIEVD
ncbi:hypothetical protein ABEF95_004767 [Exophiala dermatitidis]